MMGVDFSFCFLRASRRDLDSTPNDGGGGRLGGPLKLGVASSPLEFWLGVFPGGALGATGKSITSAWFLI